MIQLIALFLLLPATLVCADGEPILLSFSPVVIELRYIHSVEGYEVRERIVAWRCVALEELEWRGYGAGMPSSAGDVQILESKGCLGNRLIASIKHMRSAKVLVNGAPIVAEELSAETGPAYRLIIKFLRSAPERSCR